MASSNPIEFQVQVKQEPSSPVRPAKPEFLPQVIEPQNIKNEEKSSEGEGTSEDMDSDDGSSEGLGDGPKMLTHKAAQEEFQDGLMELILADELLNDLPTAITLEEVNSLISLEHGRAIIVNVRRADDVILPVVVIQNGTVLDLKKAIRGHIQLKQDREMGTSHISWRFIWRTYWLYFKGQKLNDDNKKLKDYGILNRDEVTFIKRLRNK